MTTSSPCSTATRPTGSPSCRSGPTSGSTRRWPSSTSSTCAPTSAAGGIGHALIEAVEALAAARGGRIVEVNVDGEDTDARRFYAAHGYAFIEPGATEPSYYYAKEW